MRRRKMFGYTRITNERGSLLLLSYLVVSVLIVFGAAFILLSIQESRSAQRQRQTIQALHIAEAGIEKGIYLLRQDFVNDSTSPSWSDTDFTGAPDTVNFYALESSGFNGGTYTVELKNIAGSPNEIWIRSTGVLGDISQRILVYAKMVNLSPWTNAIFAGAGAAGAMVNGNVDIRGSVHILGNSLTSGDYAVDLGGTAELVGNNYRGLASALKDRVPPLPTVWYEGENVETLSSELRVKRGLVGLSGSATVGEAQTTGNAEKESVDGVYTNDGFGGNQAENNVYSDNGWSNTYDLGDMVQFPSLSDPYPGYATYLDYLRDNAYVVTDSTDLSKLANITPSSNFSLVDTNGKGSISVDGAGQMQISGIVVVEGGNLGFSGGEITYSGKGTVVVTGTDTINVNVEADLVTDGINSFPNNILGIMTTQGMEFDTSQLDVMGVFYAEDRVVVKKQTDILGTIVSNYFDMGSQVPSIFQVPETVNNLPPGMIGQDGGWILRVVSWQHI